MFTIALIKGLISLNKPLIKAIAFAKGERDRSVQPHLCVYVHVTVKNTL